MIEKLDLTFTRKIFKQKASTNTYLMYLFWLLVFCRILLIWWIGFVIWVRYHQDSNSGRLYLEQWCTYWTLSAKTYYDKIFQNGNNSACLVSLSQFNFTRLFEITREIVASVMQYFIIVTMISFHHFFLSSFIDKHNYFCFSLMSATSYFINAKLWFLLFCPFFNLCIGPNTYKEICF